MTATVALPRPVAPQHTARYFDSGFYLISDKAASALVKQAGKPLPRFGYEMSVELCDASRICFAKCWLQRTSNRFRENSPARGWSWAIYAFKKPDDCLEHVTLGREFTFNS